MELGVLKVIPFSEILFDESTRGRKDYGDIEELAQSIREQSLINPLTVYSPSLIPPYELLAGGRRYKALELLGVSLVPVRIYDKELTERERKIIELYENLRRKELSYIERANMTKLIHETLQELRGAKLPGASLLGQSTRDTAKLLGVSQQSLNNDIKLSRMHSQFPELGLDEKKNASQALHAINRIERAVRVRVRSPNIASSSLSGNYKIGNFLTSPIERGQFNFIEIDPPYGIDLENIKDNEDKSFLQGYQEVPLGDYKIFVENLIQKVSNVAAEDAILMIWTPPQYYHLIFNTLSGYGWNTSWVPAIWLKTNSTGQSRSPSHWLGGSYEPFLYAHRGEARIVKEGRSNVFAYPVVPPIEKIHPTQKPFDLMQELINTFCLPGYSILVPFAGSGVTIAAAFNLGYKVIGYDLNEMYKHYFVATFERANNV
jgi:ParB/RepB/Spo0J family partition protein